MMQALTKKRNQLGNKGFSLIELIIVIAIMAALIAILAPQYLKYVEKSRVAADEATAEQILTAVKVATSDPDLKFAVDAVAGTGTTVTWYPTGDLIITGTNAAKLDTALEEALGITIDALTTTFELPVMKSTAHQANYVVELEITATSTKVLESGW